MVILQQPAMSTSILILQKNMLKKYKYTRMAVFVVRIGGKNFAVTLSDREHDVWFALDGLKGVHEIYRQGTNFDKNNCQCSSIY
jgi:hypothetical protein